MHDQFAVPVEYVWPIAGELEKRSIDVEDWLRRSGVARRELDASDGLVPYPTFRALVLEALDVTGEPALGLFVGTRMVASTHGMVGAAAVSSSTVRQALDIVERFASLRSSLITITHELGTHEGRVIFTEMLPLGDIQRSLLEAVILSVKTVLDEITMGACHVREVAFPFEEPEYAAVARDIFGCRVVYGQDWAGLSALPEVLDLPLRLANPAAFDEAARICQRELDRIAAHETVAARVRRLLLERQTGFPSLKVAARLLHMTPRTLHRRLTGEGTSFRDVLESVRHTLATEHLSSGHFDMEEIAYRLGYTDVANFRRAFKRWEGVPPATYRSARVDGRNPVSEG